MSCSFRLQGRGVAAWALQHSCSSQESRDPGSPDCPSPLGTHISCVVWCGCCKAGPRCKVFSLAQTLSSQQGCETLQLLPIPSLETSPPCQPSTSFLPNPFSHPFLPGQVHPSLPTCPLADTGAGLAGASQRADLQGILAARQEPVEEEGGGAGQEGHVPHQALGVAVPQGQAVAIPQARPGCPGRPQLRAPTAAQAQVADRCWTCIRHSTWEAAHSLLELACAW